MTPKKIHEIKSLAPQIYSLTKEKGITQIIDVGGGIGLLAQTLSNRMGLDLLSVDMDPVLQETGANRNKKNPKAPKSSVQYVNCKVTNDGPFKNLLGQSSMTLGLHTCGELALDMIRASAEKRVPVIVNFGCCYHKLKETSSDQRVSNFAQENGGLFLNKFALTLSCRAHRKMNEDDFNLKRKVKFYRYAFHILLHEEYDAEENVFLGNSPPSLYEQSFATYALEQFTRITLPLKHSKEELEAFFNRAHLHNVIKKMLAADLIRNAFGRVLELYLLLDRGIYLEEQGYEVQMKEYFNEELSPRNIGIVAKL